MKGLSTLCVLICLLALATARAEAAQRYDLGTLQYRAIGPAISGGRTTAVAGSDDDPLTYYAGGAAGGVFKSTDGGASWTPVFDKEPVAAIGAIAVAPGNPDDVWVGTGESNPRNDVEEGDGIYHSTDGGQTWKHLGLDDAGSIAAISIDPSEPRRVAVAVLGHVFRDGTMRGVYVTDDGGAHWKHTLYVGPSSGASDIVRVPGHPQVLFAGVYELRRKPWTMQSGGATGGVYRSDDGGATWRKLTGHGLPPPPIGRIGLAAAKGGRIYAIIQSKDGDIWRSDDEGATWRVLPHNSLVGDRPFYFSRLFVDPENPNKVIDVGLILSMTTDGGESFRKIATNAGWDYHVAWWSADGRRVAIGSDEGLVMSADGGADWHQPYTLPFAQPYHIGFDDTLPNYHVCIGLQDNDSWCGTSNGDSGVGVLNRDWTTVAQGDGMWVEFDPSDPLLIWSTSTNTGTGQTYLFDSRTRQDYDVSPDAEIAGLLPASRMTYRFNWDTPIAFDSSGAALVGGNVVFRSADQGRHWTPISPDLTRDEPKHQTAPGGPIRYDISGAEIADNILEIEPSRVAPGTIWIGTDDGLVQVTRDGGRHWSNVTPRSWPHWGRVAGIDAGRFNGNTAFVAVDDHMLGDERPYLYATRDGGATWQSIAGGLPRDEFFRSIRQDAVDPDLLYAGSQRGMWVSWDAGAHWQSLRLNMPASPVYDIQIQPDMDDLLVATHGRGVWVLDDLHALQQLPSANGPLTLFTPRDAYRWFRWNPLNAFPDGVPPEEFPAPNVPYGALIDYRLANGKHGSASIAIADSSGRVVRHLSGKDVPHKSGLNRAVWDLNEDGVTRWLGTYESDQGPKEAEEVVPGTFTVRLTVDGVTREATLNVRSDPRDPATIQVIRQRHDALAALYEELGGVDAMLNAIDKRMKRATPRTRASLEALRRRLTYAPRNVEDLSGPAGLREALQDLIYRISATSFQPPTAAQIDRADALHQSYTEAAESYARLR